MTHPVRFLDADHLRAAHSLFYGALHLAAADDEAWERTAPSYVPGRTVGVHDGDTLVATATSSSCSAVVPGGAVLEAAAVTRVAVRADHTRRGLLSAMMRAQLDDVAARGEVLASLRATEARIYGRFGYGVATRGRDVAVRRSGRGWRPSAPGGGPGAGTVRLVPAADVLKVLTPLYDRLALRRAGSITRQDAWWTAQLDRHVRERHPMLVAVHTGPDGDDGFALAVPRESDAGFADRILRVEDLHAASTAATAALWRFLLDVDLVGTVEGGLRPLDEPLELLLADPRDVTVTGVHDETWLRIVDVPVALAARSYGEAGPVLLAVHDPLLETNAGVYRIADGTAERVGPLGGPHAPQLECDAAALAMAYLGDRAPSQLAATGWWTAHDAAALERADRLFATGSVPWCGTFF